MAIEIFTTNEQLSPTNYSESESICLVLYTYITCFSLIITLGTGIIVAVSLLDVGYRRNRHAFCGRDGYGRSIWLKKLNGGFNGEKTLKSKLLDGCRDIRFL